MYTDEKESHKHPFLKENIGLIPPKKNMRVIHMFPNRFPFENPDQTVKKRRCVFFSMTTFRVEEGHTCPVKFRSKVE